VGRVMSRPRYRSLVLQVVVIAGLLALVALVISGVVPGSSGRLSRTSIAWIVVAAVVELAACAAYAWLFHGAFSHGEYVVSPGRATQIGVGELAGFAVSPTGAGGPALRLWALLRGGMPFAVVMTRSVLHAVVFQVPYVVAALLLGVCALFGLGGGHAHTALALAPVALIVAAVLLAVWISRLARRPAGAQSRWRSIARDIIQAVPNGIRATPRRLRERPTLLLAAIGYWAADCGVLVIAFAAVHGSAPIVVIVLAYMLGQLGNALPLPGGVGGVEPAMLGVLTSSGVDPALGGAAVILYRFVSLGLQSACGAVAIATLIPALSRHAAPDQAHAPPSAEPATA
jgi:putative heme transporter